MVIIVGKDRATGTTVDAPRDMEEDVEREETNNDITNDTEDTIGANIEDFDSYNAFSPMQSPGSEGS